jgi:beta-lactamase regulating signal transducer with metallopeptidase domain
MPDTITQLSETLIRALGHSLWQAALISGIVWLLLRTLPAKHAERRYAIALGGLAGIVAAALVTWSVLRLEPTESNSTAIQNSRPVEQTVRIFDAAPAPHQSAPAELQAEVAELAEHTRKNPLSSAADATSSINGGNSIVVRGLAVIWLCGAVVMLLRGLAGFVIARRWLVESAAVAESGLQELTEIVKELSGRLKLRRMIRIVLSDRIDTPAVVGVLWPVIMVPVSMLTGVPADQWRIMIAHELAHIRRWDPIVSLIQVVVESLLFFNPFVWWLNRIIRAEREACCDAVAARICGQPMSVAKTLVDMAASIHRPLISSAMAFAEPSSEGELSDRVLRLVQPDRPPRLKVSLLSVALVMVVLAATLVVLQRGTDIAVQTAASWMSPKERVEKLVQLEAERNGNFVPARVSSADGSSASDDPNAGMIAVHVIVKTDDGSKITPKLTLHYQSRAGNNGVSGALDGLDSETVEYKKTHYFRPCRLLIGASHPDFAAVSSPVVTLMPEDKEKAIELILTRGSTVDALVTDERGQPVSQAAVKYTAVFGFGGSWSGGGAQDIKTNEAGRLELSRIAKATYSIEVKAKGYQRLRLIQSLEQAVSTSSREPFKLVLKPARPVSVRVLNKQSSQPIADARLRITYRKMAISGIDVGFSRRWTTPDPWLDFAISNSDGIAVLDQLEDDTVYTFAVVAENYGVGVFDVSAGDDERTLSLSPPIRIAGQFTGDLQQLEKCRDVARPPGFQVSVLSQMGSATRDLEDEYWMYVDPKGHFELNGLAQDERLILRLPNYRKELQITESMTELEIPLQPVEPESGASIRDVLIRLTGTDPDAPAQGKLFVTWSHPTARMDAQSDYNMPITSNEVRLKVPVGAFLNFRQENLAGYRIDDQRQIAILPGSAPQVIEAPVTAVGGVYGSIKRADGSPADRGFATVLEMELPPGEKDSSRVNSPYSQAGFQFMKSVPFGGRYRLLVHEDTDEAHVWTVSEEFTIDESNPIVKMDVVLPSGRDLKLHVVDKDGKPVAAQEVKLSFSFTQKSGGFFSRKPRRDFGSHSFSTTAVTDSNGVCTFRNLSIDHPLEGIELKLTATIEPGPYRGKSQTISLAETRQPVEIVLSRGLTASGYLIDVATNKPVPNAEIRLMPQQYSSEREYQGWANAKTDATGRFEFSGLDPTEYRGHINDAYPKGAVLQPQSDGGLSISYPANVQHLNLTPTDPPGEPVRWEVILNPRGSLKPLD